MVGGFFVDSACLRARLLACMDVGGCGTDGRFGILVRTRVEGRERVQVGRGDGSDLDMRAGQYLAVELPTFCLARLPRNA